MTGTQNRLEHEAVFHDSRRVGDSDGMSASRLETFSRIVRAALRHERPLGFDRESPEEKPNRVDRK
eukprot:98136-Hanusia_phi.AAC.1